MSKIEKAILTLNEAATSSRQQLVHLDPRAQLIVTLIYLIFVLLIPLDRLSLLIWFAIYPIIASALAGIGYATILLRSLYILPVVILFGIFNPILDRTPVLQLGYLTLTHGWLTFVSLTLRALLSFQALLILIISEGFTGLCKGMNKLGVPGFLTSQILFVYRYLTVLLQETLTMKRAREARGYGRKTMPLKFWGEFIGQLFLRTIARSERIHRAMISRGFNGTMPAYNPDVCKWTAVDLVYVTVWTGIFCALFFLPVTTIFSHLLNR